MKKTRLPLLLAVGYALLLPSLSPADAVVEEIIARVNNEIITRTEYIRSRDQLKQEVQQQDAANADRAFAEKQRDVLRDLIDQQLLLQKGKDLGITGDTELVKRLDEMRKQMNLATMEELEKAAEAQGASYEYFKHNPPNRLPPQTCSPLRRRRLRRKQPWRRPRPKRRICSSRFTKAQSLQTWRKSTPMDRRRKTVATSVISSAVPSRKNWKIRSSR